MDIIYKSQCVQIFEPVQRQHGSQIT